MVNPLLKHTLNKEHNTFKLSIKDKFCDPYRVNGSTILPLKEDNVCIRNSKIALKLNKLIPKRLLFRGFTVVG